MRLTLRGKYVLIIAMLSVTLVTTLASVLLQQFLRSLEQTSVAATQTMSRALEAQMEHRARGFAVLTADNATNALYQFNMEALREQLQNLLGQPDVVQARIFDESGDIVHDGSETVAAFGEPMADPFGQRAAQAQAVVFGHSDTRVYVAAPIHIGQNYLGGVRIDFSRRALLDELDNLQQRMGELSAATRNDYYVTLALAVSLVLLVAMVVAAAVSEHLSRPIRALAATATRLGRGDTGTAVEIRRRDEVGELADAFRDMRDNLRRTTVSRDFLDRIIECMNDALLVTDASGELKMANRTAHRLFKFGAEGPQPGMRIQTLVADSGCHLPSNAHRDDAAPGGECLFRDLEGNLLPVAFSVAQMGDNGEAGYVYVLQDISERRENEQRRQLASSVFDNTPEGIIVADPLGTILQVNPAFTTITGFPRDASMGMNIRELAAVDDIQCENLRRQTREKGHWQGELRYRRADGREFPVWLTASAVRDDQGAVQQLVVVFSDLSERKEAEARIHSLAYYDSLTGLPNRLLFQDRLQQAVAQGQRHEHKVALLFLDLDRFKIINDTKGHAVGDALLKEVAKRLAAELRQSDTIGRLGGDEFAVVLPEVRHEDYAAEVARKLIKSFAKPFQAAGYEIFSATSIGISTYPADADDTETLLKAADAAMYRAKEQGRNTYQFFTPDLNARVMEHVALEQGMRQALEHDGFELYLQPQFDISGQRLSGAEALLRWRHPERGYISPAQFIPVAEDSGLIVEIGEWVLHRACRVLSQWQQAGLRPPRVAVNLSARQFQDRQLVSHIENALSQYALEPSQLEVEITESLLMDDLERTIATLMRLNEMGVRISVDDFGTGYSSLSYLKRFPIHILKIDRTFIRDILDDPDDAAITSAIITMAHSLGLRVLAEGVETGEQQDFLAERGCDYVQGFLFARPMPEEEFARLLSAAGPG